MLFKIIERGQLVGITESNYFIPRKSTLEVATKKEFRQLKLLIFLKNQKEATDEVFRAALKIAGGA